MMNQMAIQAAQFVPRFISMVILITVTWLVAKFIQSFVLRATHQCCNTQAKGKFAILVSNLTFWITIIAMSPFILGAAGLDGSLIVKMKGIVAQFFSYWPTLMITSVIIAITMHLISEIPKLYAQLKGSPDTSTKKL